MGQALQPEGLAGAAGVEQAESEDEPAQADDLSSSLDHLNVTSLPEASVVRPNQDYNLVNSLLNLTRSPVSHRLYFVLFLNIVIAICTLKKRKRSVPFL